MTGEKIGSTFEESWDSKDITDIQSEDWPYHGKVYPKDKGRVWDGPFGVSQWTSQTQMRLCWIRLRTIDATHGGASITAWRLHKHVHIRQERT